MCLLYSFLPSFQTNGYAHTSTLGYQSLGEWPTKTLSDKDHEVHDKTNTIIYSLKKYIYLFRMNARG
jgi:hypothetical protein